MKSLAVVIVLLLVVVLVSAASAQGPAFEVGDRLDCVVVAVADDGALSLSCRPAAVNLFSPRNRFMQE